MRLYDVVEDLLRKYPPLRNSDKLLVWNVWGTMGHLASGVLDKGNFLSAPSGDSITRARRKIVETYPELDATEKSVKAARRQKEEEKGSFIYREKA